MSFSKNVWDETKPIYDAILAHPFNVELAAGTLSEERFSFYVQQDSLYLADYARSLAILAAKAPTSDAADSLLAYAKGGIEVEQALHSHFFKIFRISPASRQEPACFAYTQFLLARCALDSYAVGLAAVLPCFWIYREVGLHIAARASMPNPYAAWISTYSDEAFGRVVSRMIQLTDQAAESASPRERDAMREAYSISARCEWRFWDGAYQLERWPV